MKPSKLLAVVLTLGLIMVLAGDLQAAPRYRWHTTNPGAGSQVVAVNDKGQAVVNGLDQVFLWTLSGGTHVLGALGPPNKSYAYGINNFGMIVGESYINDTTSAACLWDQNGVKENLGVVNNAPRNIALSINDQGMVIGASLFADNSVITWTWTKADGNKPLDLQGGIAFKILNDGRMVGQKNNRAWLWTAPGAGQDLGTLPAPYNGNSEAHDINQNDQVVGWAMKPNSPNDNDSRAFSWTPNGGLKDLGTLGGPNSRAFGINKSGDIVGWADTASGTVGCLWTPKGDKLNLDTLVVNKPAGQNLIVGNCTGINGNGVIVGHLIDDMGPFMLVPTAVSLEWLSLLLE